VVDLGWLSQYGGWGLLVITVILIIVYYDKIEKPVARIYQFFSWVRASWRKRAVKASIESNINSFSRTVDTEMPGTMPYNIRLQFVSEMDRAELLHEKNLVLVRIRDRLHDDKNLVHAMLSFCPVGLIPASRPYLSTVLAEAVDYTVTRKLLNTMQHHSALKYFYDEVINPEMERNPGLKRLCAVLSRLDEQGLLTRVALRELRDFGAKVRSLYPTEAHKKETTQFVEYMDVVATRAPKEEIDTQFEGGYISMGFVFIGTVEKVEQLGAVPYLRAIQFKKGKSIETIYLAARDWYIGLAERIAHLAERKGLAKIVGSPTRYCVTDKDGRRKQQILIVMRTIAAPLFAPPEQGMLLEE